MNIVIRRTMSGLDEAFSTFNWKESKELNDVLKFDERDFTTKVSKGSKVFKITQTEKHFIYSVVINVLDNSGRTGFVCISVISNDKNKIIYNFQSFLDHLEAKYNLSKNPEIFDKNYFQDLYGLAEYKDLYSFIIPHIENASIIVKANFNVNFTDNYTYTLCCKEVYFFDEKMNYDFGYIAKEFNKIDYQFVISKYRFVIVSIEEEASNVCIYINGNIYPFNNSLKKYKFLLNKEVQLAYSYVNGNNQIFPINGNEVIIKKNIVQKPIVNKSEEALYTLRGNIENLKNDNESLNTKLKTYKILSAVLGALLLITLISGGYWTNKAINERDKEKSELEEKIENLEKEISELKDKVKTGSSSGSNPSIINPQETTSKSGTVKEATNKTGTEKGTTNKTGTVKGATNKSGTEKGTTNKTVSVKEVTNKTGSGKNPNLIEN
jgi:hypothetical protein